MKAFFILSALLLSLPALAFEAKFEFPNFETASQAESYLRFDLKTKKLGLFSSELTGYVKSFEAKGDLKQDSLQNGLVRFKVRDMDTDLYARNDQMWNLCLDYKKFDTIEIHLPKVFFGKENPQSVNASMLIRGKNKPIQIELSREREGDSVVISGNARLSFQQLEIPDPSIGVASVNDEILVRFQIKETAL